MVLKHFYFILFFLLFILACEKKPKLITGGGNMADNRHLFVGKYLPLYFGSKWYYTVRKVDKGEVLSTSQKVWRFDSLDYVIHIYNPTILISWIYCSRDDDHNFTAGGGQNLLTDRYVDSTQGKPYLVEQNTAHNYSKYTYGGLVQLATKFGNVPCIHNYGISGVSSNYFYYRHFGENYGMLREETYQLSNGGDTLNHFITELDSCFIKR